MAYILKTCCVYRKKKALEFWNHYFKKLKERINISYEV